MATLIAALFAAWRIFFEYSSWRNLDWLMVATEGESNEGNDGNVRGQGNVQGQRRMNVLGSYKMCGISSGDVSCEEI